ADDGGIPRDRADAAAVRHPSALLHRRRVDDRHQRLTRTKRAPHDIKRIIAVLGAIALFRRGTEGKTTDGRKPENKPLAAVRRVDRFSRSNRERLPRRTLAGFPVEAAEQSARILAVLVRRLSHAVLARP